MTDSSNTAATYAENVRREMRDLPAETVADLTDGLEADIAASLADGAVLPPAADYARDLMRAAGIERADSSAGGAATRIVRAVERAVKRTGRRAHGLEPAWWVFRAWVLMQLLGFLVSRVDSPYWFLGQWGGEGASNGFVGVIFFALFAVASVRVGRDGWLLSRKQAKFTSMVLAVLAVAVLTSQNNMRQNQGWFMYGTSSQCDTPQMTVACAPSMRGRDLRSAVEELSKSAGIPYRVIDEATGYDLTNSAGLPSVPVLRQIPNPGELMIDGELVLYVDTSAGDPTLVTPTTDLPQQSAIPETTTTTMLGTNADAATTTTRPRAKVTPTTAP